MGPLEKKASAAGCDCMLRRRDERFAAQLDLPTVIDIKHLHIDEIAHFAHFIQVVDAAVVVFRDMEESFFIKDFNKSPERYNRHDLSMVGFADFYIGDEVKDHRFGFFDRFRIVCRNANHSAVSSISICAPDSSMMDRIILPPGPMTVPILLGFT